MQSLTNITAATHVIANSNIYANSGTMFGQHANVSGNVYANGGTIFSNIANIAGNIYGNANLYIANGTLFSNTASLTGNVYANTGTVYSQHANISGNVYANGTVFGTNANVSGDINAEGIVYANSANVSGSIIANGNITGATLIGSLFSGNGNALTNLNAANIVGTVGTATQIVGATQGNITSLANLASIGSNISINSATGTMNAASFNGNYYGNGYTLASVNAANISGRISLAGTANVANSVAWANVSGRPSNLTQFTNDLSSAAIIASLGYTPYNSSNPSAYITAAAINSSTIASALGFTPISSTGSISGSSGSVSGVTLQAGLGTGSTTTHAALNIGSVSTSATTGQIRATDNITAYAASDAKWKENVRPIPNALQKAVRIGGKLFDWTEEYLAKNGGEDGYFVRKEDFGVIAQDLIAAGFKEGTRSRPDGTLAVDYEKLSALALQAVAELYEEVQQLKEKK